MRPIKPIPYLYQCSAASRKITRYPDNLGTPNTHTYTSYDSFHPHPHLQNPVPLLLAHNIAITIAMFREYNILSSQPALSQVPASFAPKVTRRRPCTPQERSNEIDQYHNKKSVRPFGSRRLI
ncbi:hypothetical protein VTL71DRAFT_2373 [Oculimacula yallundae]|uniref:Uncharacterized protein n=1 Tax=Oculimacula yallundae TaxID=86028 RepID=A0ABR4C9X3_9HELO